MTSINTNESARASGVPALIIAVMFCSAVFADQIQLRDGEVAKVTILDTAGCEVIYSRNDNVISKSKVRIKSIVWKSDTISYSDFVCTSEIASHKSTKTFPNVNTHAAKAEIVLDLTNASPSGPRTPNPAGNRVLPVLQSDGAGVGLGMAFHFAGIGLSALASLGAPQPSSTYTVVSATGAILWVAGPIISCASASNAETVCRGNGFMIEGTDVFREYGRGWAMTGAGAAVIVGGALIGMSSRSEPVLMVCAVGGTALEICGEVMWIRSMVHSIQYVSKCKEFVRENSITLVPTFDAKGHYGLCLQMGIK